MISPAAIGAALEASASDDLGRKRLQQLRPLRGVRGVPASAVVSVLVDAWRRGPPTLPGDAASLHALFATAHEDGLVAIGLLAAALPDGPVDALELAEEWLMLTDDVETADAIGWLLLGPGLLAAGEPFAECLHAWRDGSVWARRGAVTAALAALPEPVEGPAAAALRERVGQRRVAFVAEPRSDDVEPVVFASLGDSDPHVRKGVARVLRAWGQGDPDRVESFVAAHRTRLAPMLREDAERGIRQGRRGRAVVPLR